MKALQIKSSCRFLLQISAEIKANFLWKLITTLFITILRAKTLSDEALAFAQEHLWITCFLYGLLRPMDGIVPYRMEHCVTLEATGDKPVNQFWRDSLHQTYQRVVGYLFAVYLNALVEAVDERRSVQAHPIPRRLQAGRQHGGSAALAVGTRHMDEAELLVGVAQRRQQSAGAAEARLVAGPLDSVDVFQSGFVVHRNASFHFLGKRLRALVARG